MLYSLTLGLITSIIMMAHTTTYIPNVIPAFGPNTKPFGDIGELNVKTLRDEQKWKTITT